MTALPLPVDPPRCPECGSGFVRHKSGCTWKPPAATVTALPLLDETRALLAQVEEQTKAGGSVTGRVWVAVDDCGVWDVRGRPVTADEDDDTSVTGIGMLAPQEAVHIAAWSPENVLAWCAEQRDTLDDAEHVLEIAHARHEAYCIAPAGCSAGEEGQIAVRMVARVHAALTRTLGSV